MYMCFPKIDFNGCQILVIISISLAMFIKTKLVYLLKYFKRQADASINH